MLIDRRGALAGGLAIACLPIEGGAWAARLPDLAGALAALEARSGGRLGVALLDSADGSLIGHRIDERFTMCSTFKLSLAGLILAKLDVGEIADDQVLAIGKDDPVGHSPAVRAALAKGETSMNVLTLAEAAQVQSDNGAANLLLRMVGGPEALTAYWRSLGDKVSRLDRYEPELNDSHDGDPRDTTTPAAMARTLRALVITRALRSESRGTLIRWMLATQTGLRRVRGGLPKDWPAGDKTGTMTGASYADKINDIAAIWHPKRARPFLLTAYLEAGGRNGEENDAVLAEVGRLAARWIRARVGG